MSWLTTCYGWKEGNQWFLSMHTRDAKRGKNNYASKEEAEKAAVIKDSQGRIIQKMTIIWEM